MRKMFFTLSCAMLLLGGGRAQAATMSGTVTDEVTGEPVVNAGISLTQDQIAPIPRTAITFRSPFIRTDADGRFTITDVPLGTYFLSVTPLGQRLLPESYDDVPAYDHDNRTPIEISDPEQTEELSIALSPRPFYFDSLTFDPPDILRTGGSGKMKVKVVSTVPARTQMRFWITYTATRTDRTNFNGLQSHFTEEPSPNRFFSLRKGGNTIELPIRIRPQMVGAETNLRLTLSGGANQYQPMLPEFTVFSPVSIAVPTPPPAPAPPPVASPPILTPAPLPPNPLPQEPIVIPGPPPADSPPPSILPITPVEPIIVRPAQPRVPVLSPVQSNSVR